MASRWIGQLLDLLIGKPTDTAAASGASGSLQAHIRSVQDTVAVIATDTTTDIPTLIGAGTDAVVNPGTAGSLHAHIRDAQTELDALIVTVGDSTAAAADLDGTGAVKVFAGLRKIRDLITTVDTVVDTIAADVADTAKGRQQTLTYTNAAIATDAGLVTTHTAAGGYFVARTWEIEAVDAPHANLTSFTLGVYRGGNLVSALCVDAIQGARTAFVNVGYKVVTEKSLTLYTGDLVRITVAGAAGGTCSIKVRVIGEADTDGATLTPS